MSSVRDGAIVNPAKLSPERRDAVCMQCHLEGKVAIERPGRHAYEFRPGESLNDYMRYYVMAGDGRGTGRGKPGRGAGPERMQEEVGIPCPAPAATIRISEPPAEERVSYYREKCIACHGDAFRNQAPSQSA